jgi:excisionase family DNA binding protein
MPIKINRQTYYRTTEAAKLAGISRSTLLRWINGGIIKGASHRDRRGWRLFTDTEIKELEVEAGKLK